MGFALWLVPASSQTPVIKAVQARLRESHPTTPIFEPHVTLLSGFDEADSKKGVEQIWEITKKEVLEWGKSRSSGSLDVKLEDVTTRNMFFQCILASLHKDERLMALNLRLRKAFNLDHSQPAYFPHLSLLYGNLTPEEIQNTIKTLTDEGVIERKDSGVAIGAGKDGDKFDALLLFSVELWDCEGKPEEWKQVHSLTL
ncbi:unnamed protein product [Tilletia controversa]|uniref:2',3'-cyclic-nucleotide 3'-phosphodiesterase n=2 Tax=Tilletia TaxID=13289 RepID=A0A9N8LTU0_9BASI|nr:unnamed protein product [Tilletia caries]CAD6918564.1 unnamed protein product [Tilletia controversa]CAD6929320.1 unnamed protein product [Tilletia laevis]CAD6919770.1 unnamed protein product [Tilletia controversa]CAD6941559.1 unnamed protein product [Tilletia laevis]